MIASLNIINNDAYDVVREMLFFLLLFPEWTLGNKGISYVNSVMSLW